MWKVRLKSTATMHAQRWLSKRRRSDVGHCRQRLSSIGRGPFEGRRTWESHSSGAGAEGLAVEWSELLIEDAEDDISSQGVHPTERERVETAEGAEFDTVLWNIAEIGDALSSTNFRLPSLDKKFTWHAVPVVESYAMIMQEQNEETPQLRTVPLEEPPVPLDVLLFGQQAAAPDADTSSCARIRKFKTEGCSRLADLEVVWPKREWSCGSHRRSEPLGKFLLDEECKTYAADVEFDFDTR